MNTKDEGFNNNLKALVERKGGKTIKVLSYDTQGEDTSKDFHAFCRNNIEEGASTNLVITI